MHDLSLHVIVEGREKECIMVIQYILKILPLRITIRYDQSANNLKKDPLEIQHPKFENSRLDLTESVRER